MGKLVTASSESNGRWWWWLGRRKPEAEETAAREAGKSATRTRDQESGRSKGRIIYRAMGLGMTPPAGGTRDGRLPADFEAGGAEQAVTD